MVEKSKTPPRWQTVAVANSAIPRAPGLPLLGSLPALLRERFDFFLRARERCGDIFVLDLGVQEVVVVADPIAAEEVFVSRSKNFDKGEEFWNGAREAVGNGLALSDGELWRRQRRLMNPEFRREKIAGFRATIEATVDELLDELERMAGDETLDISGWTSNLLTTLTVRLLIGTELEPETFARLRSALGVILDGILSGIVTRKLPGWVPVPGASEFEQARQTIDEIILGMISERRAASEPGHDLLGMLLAATDEDGVMSDRQLRDEVVVTYIAGYETTAWALAWGLMLLAEHGQLVADLQAEVDAHDNLMAIPLLDATVREILRLYPSVPFLPRRAVVDEELLGYPIPAGTTVVVLPWLIHRNPKFWPNPTRFDPRRHLDAPSRPRLAWMPFGAGQRVCIGQGLALMEANVALGKLLRRFTPMRGRGRGRGRGHKRSEPRLSATLSSRDGIWIRMQARG
jgi:cytochrome P450